MRSVSETDVTARAAGVWSLSGGRLIINEPDGPATILVPTESVLLLAVDLPLSSRAKRLEALPFAIEDRIADSIDAVHLALGAAIAPKRYLVGVVRHQVMANWVEAADAAGLGHAAIVPDALALPVPAEGGWSVDLAGSRAVVRAGDGTGFALGAAMLRPAWEAAGKPPATAYGAPLPAEMMLEGAALEPEALASRLAPPALDLRQGAYARRRATSNTLRRIGWIVALGAAAHTGIALADTVMLRVIADRRAEDTRKLVTQMAPGVPVTGDVAATAANLLPAGGGGGAPQVFLPLLNRVSGALAPLGVISAQKIAFEGNMLILDLDAQPGLADRIRSAMASARIRATVAESPTGIRLTATGA
ncbi:type II secretion system protein GspL [Sphingomonas sp. LB-2]|uniref:type II secretion system protein GspL n=1 Tax=Sphingomonas caeni TaxID=2984949 RepID=UPI00222F57AC|nr:type II secretion system protein GspL [Sphingomonas caeni]MCW3847450.1 type II secretion system protein GspL [Sphingomonas caeni]